MSTIRRITLEEGNKIFNTNYLEYKELESHYEKLETDLEEQYKTLKNNLEKNHIKQWKELYSRLFDRLDNDRDGFLTFDDWKKVYRSYGENFTEEDFNEILEKCPEVQDKIEGKINYDTFINLAIKLGI